MIQPQWFLDSSHLAKALLIVISKDPDGYLGVICFKKGKEARNQIAPIVEWNCEFQKMTNFIIQIIPSDNIPFIMSLHLYSQI